MKPNLTPNIAKKIEENIKSFFKKNPVLLTDETNGPRAVGDAMQQILERNFKSIAGSLVGKPKQIFGNSHVTR